MLSNFPRIEGITIFWQKRKAGRKQYIIGRNTEASISVGVFFVRIFGGIGMATDFSKGMIAVATSYSGGQYHYEKLDPYIEPSSLNIIPDATQEDSSYRNANGGLKRPNIMPLTISKVEGNIVASKEKDLEKVMKILQKAVKVPGGIANERKIKIRFYNQEKMEYKHAWAYYPEFTFNVYGTYNGDGGAVYNATRIAFITYGEKRD